MAVACQMITFLPAFKLICKKYKNNVWCNCSTRLSSSSRSTCCKSYDRNKLQGFCYLSSLVRRKLAVNLGWTEILNKKTFSKWIKKDLFQQNHSILQPVLSPAPSPQSVVAQCNQLSYILCVCIVLFNICPADQGFSFQDRTSTRNSNRSVSTAAINSL